MNEIELRAASSPPLSVIDIANWRSQFGVSSVSLPRDNHVETQWPDPLPFAVQEVCSMQSEVLPGQLGEYCASLAHSTETPPELSLLAILGVLSTAIAGKVQIEAEASYIEPANIYVCAVLESGNRKTAVIDAVTRPLREYEAEEHRRILPEIARLESERKTRMAIIERLRKRVKDGDQALVERISTLEADLPSVPHLPVLFTSDSTAEKLEVLLQESDGHIALISDEGGLFDVMNGRYNKKPNLDVFLKGHCQAPLRVHRMGRTIAVDNPHVTILVSPQPGVLKGLQDFMRSRGLLARFLFVLPKSTVGNRKLIPSHISSELTTDYKRVVSKILDWRPSSTHRLRLAPDAYQVWKDFQMAVEEEMREGRRLCRLRDWGSKLPGACLRIATLLHVAAHAEKLPTLPGVTSKLEITSAVQICRSLISHAAAIFGMMSEDPIVTHSKRIFKWLVEDGRAEIPRRICFRAHQPHVFQNIQELDVCLNVLSQHRLLRVFERKTGGRSSEIIQLNPRLREADLEQVQISQVEK